MSKISVTLVQVPSPAKQFLPFAEGYVAAGFPSPAQDYEETPLDLNEYVTFHPEATFFVRTSGESMIEAGIRDQDILVVDKAIDPKPGHVVIAALEGEFLVKRLLRKEGRLFLVPDNHQYQPIEITPDRDCLIWGVVTHVLHTLVSHT